MEMWLTNLGMEVLAVRSVHKQADRDRAIERFNNPADSAKTMTTSLRVASTALNLQYGGCDVAFVDVPTNAQSATATAPGVECTLQRAEEVIWVPIRNSKTLNVSYIQKIKEILTDEANGKSRIKTIESIVVLVGEDGPPGRIKEVEYEEIKDDDKEQSTSSYWPNEVGAREDGSSNTKDGGFGLGSLQTKATGIGF
ncbi:MAG: hypothetical protein Q9225_007403 [Loekoesia sp. 1 TL-2023]